ncbi:hypothetical protein ACCO45_004176 [Purpureocillium lilacinum]|uniref:Uncharacterized protein n=1 Tax=Purpureocillium lilacinum TaxID=33203 RepID=A0ACC4E2U8_PURLI
MTTTTLSPDGLHPHHQYQHQHERPQRALHVLSTGSKTAATLPQSEARDDNYVAAGGTLWPLARATSSKNRDALFQGSMPPELQNPFALVRAGPKLRTPQELWGPETSGVAGAMAWAVESLQRRRFLEEANDDDDKLLSVVPSTGAATKTPPSADAADAIMLGTTPLAARVCWPAPWRPPHKGRVARGPGTALCRRGSQLSPIIPCSRQPLASAATRPFLDEAADARHFDP